VAEDPQLRTVILAVLEPLEQAADPEQDVTPALPAGGPVVELAEQLPAPGLVGVCLTDTGPGEAVEPAEVALAQPLVLDDVDLDVAARKSPLRSPPPCGRGR